MAKENENAGLLRRFISRRGSMSSRPMDEASQQSGLSSVQSSKSKGVRKVKSISHRRRGSMLGDTSKDLGYEVEQQAENFQADQSSGGKQRRRRQRRHSVTTGGFSSSYATSEKALNEMETFLQAIKDNPKGKEVISRYIAKKQTQ